MYVPSPVDHSGGYRLLKPDAPSPFIDAICKPDDVFIDVGANVGNWTLAAARAVGKGGRVLAFEPVPRVAETLRKTVKANRLQQVKVFEMALAEASGTRPFSVESPNTGGSRLGAMSDDPSRFFEHIHVTTGKLDEVAHTEHLSRVDVIKIDVEGFEYAVLQGTQAVLNRFKPALILETGHENAQSRAGIERLLAPIGYGIVGVLVGHGLLEASWGDYSAQEGVFRELALADLLLMV